MEFGSKQLTLVKESNYPAKFESLSRFPILETTPFGVDLFCREGFEQFNATGCIPLMKVTGFALKLICIYLQLNRTLESRPFGIFYALCAFCLIRT